MSRVARALLALLGLAISGVLVALRGDRHHASGSTAETRARLSGMSWKGWLWHTAVLLLGLGIVGVLVAVSGVIPIKASAGHWPITRWFLDFAKVRAVSTQSLVVQPPDLDDPALVLKGAGHFDFGCRPCHGDVVLPQPQIPHAMTPHPPYLPSHVPRWETDELFFIVKHGIKFTGMPAWTTQQRDDEVWAVTAFLLKMPDLSMEEYRRLVAGDVSADNEVAAIAGLPGSESLEEILTESCARCHGADGNGRGMGAFPVLAGQTAEYLAESLQAYATGERHSGIMGPLAAGLDDQQLRQLALYYARLEGLGVEDPGVVDVATDAVGESERLALGRRIALEGLAEQNLPACADCHGPLDETLDDHFPQLAGQYADYLVLQLELFKQRSRGGTEWAHLMHEVADNIEPEQMQAVAEYYESIGRRP